MRGSKLGDSALLAIACCTGAAAIIFRVLAARLALPLPKRWEHFPDTLPFSIRFVLDRGVTTLVVGGCALLLISGVLAFALTRWRSFARGVLLVLTAFGLSSAGIAGVGLQQAARQCVFTRSNDVECCRCPTTPELIGFDPLECHCTTTGLVRETIWDLERFEGSTIGDRLRFPRPGAADDSPFRLVRVKSTADGVAYTIDGTAAPVVQCRYGVPCSSQTHECGPCQLDEDGSPTVLEIDADLSCIDAKVGRGALTGFVELRRTVWADEGTGQNIPTDLDEAKSIPTERTELIGSVAELERSKDRGVAGAVLGGGRAAPMRRGGVRTCRVLTTLSPMLTGQLDGELTTARAIVRLEVVGDNAR